MKTFRDRGSTRLSMRSVNRSDSGRQVLVLHQHCPRKGEGDSGCEQFVHRLASTDEVQLDVMSMLMVCLKLDPLATDLL